VSDRVLAVANGESGGAQPVSGVTAEADADDRVEWAVRDGDRKIGYVGESKVEALDTRESAG
jgi:hypothetical protein